MKRFALALPVFLLFATCTAYRAQHGIAHGGGAPSRTAAATDSAPHHHVASAADSAVAAAIESQPLDAKGAILLSELDKYINDLKAEGKYDCCVRPACRQCAMNAGECHCRQVINANGPCCGECTQAWVEGRGVTEGVDREAVLAHLGCVRELYEKKVPEGIAPPGQRQPPSKNDHKH